MDTEFEILRRFETQLVRVAERDKRRAESPPSKRSRRPWKAALAAAAALLSLSLVVGLLATGGSASRREARRPARPHRAASRPLGRRWAALPFQEPTVPIRTSPRRGPRSTSVSGTHPTSKLRSGLVNSPEAPRPERQRSKDSSPRPISRRSSGTDRSRSRSTTAHSRRTPVRWRTSPRSTAARSCPPRRREATVARSRCVSRPRTSTKRWCSSRSSAPSTHRRAKARTSPRSTSTCKAHRKIYLSRRKVLFGLMSHGDDDRADADAPEPARPGAAEDRPDHGAAELHPEAGSRVDDQGRPARAWRRSGGEPRRDRPSEPRARVGSARCRGSSTSWRRPLSASGT